jgi:hypothetical protein
VATVWCPRHLVPPRASLVASSTRCEST